MMTICAKQTAYSFKQNTVKNIVPDKETAIKIAEAVAIPIYGLEILKERPFNVQLIKDSIWVVIGSQKNIEVDSGLIKKDKIVRNAFYVVKGGVLNVMIAKSDGRIIRITHSR